MAMLIQTRDAINSLKAAGFKRNEFRVRTERRRFIHLAQEVVEYGDAIITIWANRERQLSLVDAMIENGLDVILYRKPDGTLSYPYVKLAIGETGKKREFSL